MVEPCLNIQWTRNDTLLLLLLLHVPTKTEQLILAVPGVASQFLVDWVLRRIDR